jgi:hypothetical protein
MASDVSDRYVGLAVRAVFVNASAAAERLIWGPLPSLRAYSVPARLIDEQVGLNHRAGGAAMTHAAPVAMPPRPAAAAPARRDHRHREILGWTAATAAPPWSTPTGDCRAGDGWS